MKVTMFPLRIVLVIPCCCLAWSPVVRHVSVSSPVMTAIITKPLLKEASFRSSTSQDYGALVYKATKTDDDNGVIDLEIDDDSSSFSIISGEDATQNTI